MDSSCFGGRYRTQDGVHTRQLSLASISEGPRTLQVVRNYQPITPARRFLSVAQQRGHDLVVDADVQGASIAIAKWL